LDEEFPHGGVFREADRPVVGALGFGAFSKNLQEMSANRPIGLIVGDCVLIDRIQNGQPLFCSIRLRERGGVSNSRAKSGRDADQFFVEQRNRRPVSPASARTLSMYGLNCGFKLESAGGVRA